MLQKLLLDAPHLTRDNSFLTCLSYQRSVAILGPVINLKALNEFVQYHHFKMEGLNTLLDLLSGCEFFTTIDLKDAYFSISIHADHYKYLRFEWNSTLFEFNCLPFGLSSATRVLTKVLKPFVALIRNKGIRRSFILMIWPLSAPLVNVPPKRLLLLFKS